MGKWRLHIEKALEEYGVVHITSLLTIPVSLRHWVLRKYANGCQPNTLIFENDMLRLKLLTPDELVDEMIRYGMLSGAVILKHGKIVVAHFNRHKTVQTALALKLASNLELLAKSLEHHQLQSFAALGEEHAIVILKDHNRSAILFIPKTEYETVVGYWKQRAKLIEF